jgi:hypothetical protein
MKNHLRLLVSSFLILVSSFAAGADLSITASAVVPSASAQINEAFAGATITAGQLIYLDSTDLDTKSRPKAKLADCNSATAGVRSVAGIAINGASAGQRVSYVYHDPALVIAASGLTANTILVLSATAGGIAPAADVTTGWYLSVIAVVKSGTTIYFSAPGLPSGAAS